MEFELTQTLGHKTPPRVPPKPSSKSPTQSSLAARVTGGRQQSPSPVRHVKAPTPTSVRWVEHHVVHVDPKVATWTTTDKLNHWTSLTLGLPHQTGKVSRHHKEAACPCCWSPSTLETRGWWNENSSNDNYRVQRGEDWVFGRRLYLSL